MLLMQKASAGGHTANAGRVRHVYALTYAIYALACAQRVKQVVCLKQCRLCMYLCQITCTCVCAHVHSLQYIVLSAVELLNNDINTTAAKNVASFIINTITINA